MKVKLFFVLALVIAVFLPSLSMGAESMHFFVIFLVFAYVVRLSANFPACLAIAYRLKYLCSSRR